MTTGFLATMQSENIGQEELTPAEQNVLRMIVGGMSNKEIAFALDVTETTVKTHNKNLFDKIGASDRVSAATLAIKRELVRVDLATKLRQDNRRLSEKSLFAPKVR